MTGRAGTDPAAVIEASMTRATAWRAPLLVLALGLLTLGFIFAEEGAAALRIWTHDAAYNHCWLVAPVAAWLAWTRRDRLRLLRPVPLPGAALLMLPVGLAWLAAERLGIMEGRQFAALGAVWTLALAVLGWRVCRAMAAPLLYLVFLVPFGAFATPALQNATAWMIELGLRALDITHHREGLLIETRAGLFHVAEACAGLRFLIAALAFGALYAVMLFRSPWRRLIVLLLALTVPVLANGLRALGIVVLAEHLGSAEAAAADHVIYGWGFFSVVILLLILAGLPFREDGAPPRPSGSPFRRPFSAPRPTAAFILAGGLAVIGAAAAPALAARLDAGAPAPREVAASLAMPEGCAAEGDGLLCGGTRVSAQLLVFYPRVTWRAVNTELWRFAGRADDTDVTFTPDLPAGSAAWRARRGDGALVAVAAWLDGRPAGGVRSRLAQAWNSLGAAGGGVPVIAAITLRPEGAFGGAGDRALLERVLAAQEDRNGLTVQAVGLSMGR